MEVILLDNVAKIGKRYDIKKVSGGYARNFLIPKGLAEPATKDNLKTLSIRKKKMEAETKLTEELLAKSLDSIGQTTITINAKANEEGHLFAGIGREDISKALEEQAKITLDVDSIKLDKPIKDIGKKEIPVTVGEISGKILLEVVTDS